MLRHSILLFITITLLAVSMKSTVAQNRVTTDAVRGVLVDYPAHWQLYTFEDDPSWIEFSSNSMWVGMLIEPLFNDDPEELFEEWLAFVESDPIDSGSFSETQTYTLDGQWDIWRVQRVRADSHLVEILYGASANGFIVFLHTNFRIGAQDSFLPIYDEMIASVRDVDDEVVIYSGSRPQHPLIDGTIGSELDLLYIGALNTNFITDDEQYQFDYPDTWEIHTETDGRLTIISRTTHNTMMFGQLIISPVDSDSDISELVMAQFDSPLEVSDFMLNDLPASRIIAEDEVNNVRHLVMATTRRDIQVIFDVTVNSDEFEKIDSILRATLYSVRPNGETFTLSVAGDAMRTGLLSAEVYGLAPITEIIPDNTTPDTVYITDNGRFTFNYPSDWFEEYIEGLIAISNDDDIELFDPSRNDIQILIDFIEIQATNFGGNSAYSLVEEYIRAEELREYWSNVREFDSHKRDAAYADFMFEGDDQLERVYLVRLDETDTVYVRLDMIVDIDDLEGFEVTVHEIIDSIRFQD